MIFQTRLGCMRGMTLGPVKQPQLRMTKVTKQIKSTKRKRLTTRGFLVQINGRRVEWQRFDGIVPVVLLVVVVQVNAVKNVGTKSSANLFYYEPAKIFFQFRRWQGLGRNLVKLVFPEILFTVADRICAALQSSSSSSSPILIHFIYFR